MPSAQGPREGIAANAATSQKIFCDAEWHRAFKPPRCRRRRGERGNLKNVYRVPQASIQHTGERGAHGGKSEVSPRAPCAMRFRKKAQHIPCGWHSALRKADTAGREIGLIGPIRLIRRKHLEQCGPCAAETPQHMAHRNFYRGLCLRHQL